MCMKKKHEKVHENMTKNTFSLHIDLVDKKSKHKKLHEYQKEHLVIKGLSNLNCLAF